MWVKVHSMNIKDWLMLISLTFIMWQSFLPCNEPPPFTLFEFYLWNFLSISVKGLTKESGYVLYLETYSFTVKEIVLSSPIIFSVQMCRFLKQKLLRVAILIICKVQFSKTHCDQKCSNLCFRKPLGDPYFKFELYLH